MNTDTDLYLTKCQCGRTTSKAFAAAHEGLCKRCATEIVSRGKETEEQNKLRGLTHEHRTD